MEVIRRFDPWASSICTCPPKYSLSPYTGCNHGCRYCYASSYIPIFFNVRPKKDFLKKLLRDLAKLPQSSTITIANSSDPYVKLEEKLNLTKETLNILKDYNFKVALVTKSSLIQRDLEIIKKLNVVLAVSITSLDEKITNKLEPYASSPKERIETIKNFSSYIPVVCRIDPIIYPLTVQDIPYLIDELTKIGVKQVITSTYKAKKDNFQRMINTFPNHKSLWIKLYYQQGEKIGNSQYLPQSLRKEILERVKKICEDKNILFSTCREGLSELNRTICDGSYFLLNRLPPSRIEREPQP